MIKELIRYTELADARVIEVFLSTGKSLPEAEALFSHILNAQHIWASRIKGVQIKYERLQVHDKAFFEQLHQENIASLLEIEAEKPDRTVGYSTFDGSTFEDKISDILYHVINHSTYHRGQVATQFRMNGITPPVTDFIVLKREKHL
jgi:uncharacterized damage-inducible protein DinB